MKYKIETYRWELIRLSEIINELIMEVVYNAPMNNKQTIVISHLQKINNDLIKKLLKTHETPAYPINLSLGFMDIMAFKQMFNIREFDDKNLDLLSIKGKLHKIIVSI